MSRPDARHVRSLARRFRRAIDIERREEEARKRRIEERRRRRQQARKDLFELLATFGEATGHFEVEAAEEQVRYRFRQRSLRFEAQGDGGAVQITGDALTGRHRLFIEERIDTWVLEHERDPDRPPRQVVLFDDGMEYLLQAAFALEPAPADAETAPSRARIEGETFGAGNPPEPGPGPDEPGDPSDPEDLDEPRSTVEKTL